MHLLITQAPVAFFHPSIQQVPFEPTPSGIGDLGVDMDKGAHEMRLSEVS